MDEPQPGLQLEISLIVAVPEPIFIQGADLAVRSEPDVVLIGATTDGLTAIELIAEHRPHVAVVDIDLPGRDGLDITRTLRERGIETRVLMLAERQFGEIALQALTAGASGFVSKALPAPKLIDAIRQVAAGQSVLPDDIGNALAKTLRQRGESGELALSAREREVLGAISRGESAAVIAARLGLALPTVKSHLQNLYGKLGVNDRGSAVATGIRRGLI
jgi:two-component system nitrate/nitrite response regulator NarL